MLNESDLVDWTTRLLSHEGGRAPVAYLTLSVRRSARSWPQHSRVEVDGRDLALILAELVEHTRDIGHSAGAEGKSTYSVRVHAYGQGGSPAGSRTFRSSSVGLEDENPDELAETDGSAQGELVAALREMRHLVSRQGDTLERVCSQGYQLAFRALEHAQHLSTENAQLMVAASTENGSDAMQGLLQTATAALPALLAAGAAREQRAAAEAVAAVTPPQPQRVEPASADPPAAVE